MNRPVINISVDASMAVEEIERVLNREFARLTRPEGFIEVESTEEYAFPWWTFILSAFIGGLSAFGVLWVLVLVFA